MLIPDDSDSDQTLSGNWSVKLFIYLTTDFFIHLTHCCRPFALRILQVQYATSSIKAETDMTDSSTKIQMKYNERVRLNRKKKAKANHDSRH